MKYYSLGDMSNFNCIGSSCRFHCCRFWDISIDPKTEKFYRSVEGEFGDKLRDNMITKNNQTLFKLNEYGVCPFNNNEGLCDIYINLGPENMCTTCQRYPRLSINITPDISIRYLSLSCPEASRLWIGQTKPLTLNEFETGKNHNIDITRQIRFTKVVTGFETTLNILQNRELDMPDRLRLIIYFNELYGEHLKEKKDTSELINLFSGNEQQQFLKSRITPVKADSLKMQRWVLKMCSFFIQNGNFVKPLLTPIVETLQQTNSSEYPDISEMISQLYAEEKQTDFELFFAYLLFNCYFPAEKNFGFIYRLQYAMYLYYFQLCVMAYIRQKSDNPLTTDDFIMIYALIARNLEHSFTIMKDFVKLSSEILGGEASDLLSITF